MTARLRLEACYGRAWLLSQAIETNDLDAMERAAAQLQASLAGAAASGTHEAERLEALAALAEAVEQALATLRQTVAEQVDRLRQSGQLLAHLADGGPSAPPTCEEPPRAPAAGSDRTA